MEQYAKTEQVPLLGATMALLPRGLAFSLVLPPGTALKDTLVSGGGFEVQFERISRQIHLHGVRGVNAERAGAGDTAALDLDLFFGDRNIQVLGLL